MKYFFTIFACLTALALTGGCYQKLPVKTADSIPKVGQIWINGFPDRPANPFNSAQNGIGSRETNTVLCVSNGFVLYTSKCNWNDFPPFTESASVEDFTHDNTLLK